MATVNVEVTRGENVDQNIKNDYARYKDRIERSAPTTLGKKVNIDILAKIVEHRLLDSKLLSKSASKDGSPDHPLFPTSIKMAIMLSLVFWIFISYKNFLQDKKFKEEISKNQKEELRLAAARQSPPKDPADAFVFEDASNYYNVNYFGKEDVVSDVISHIVNIIKILKKNDPIKLKMLKSPQKNFLLSGPPGTGKTLLVQKVAGLLDLNLKTLEMIKIFSPEVLSKMTYKEKIDYIKKMHGKVRVIFLTPSFINDKYIGESEKRVRELFRLASLKSKYDVTIIFFDEMDAFFVKRDTQGNESHIKAQTEFLATIGGVHDKIERPVFLFGATNRPDMVDEAFDRRFANKIVFKKPLKAEVYNLVASYTSSWKNYSPENVEKVTDLMIQNGMYQSAIVEEITAVHLYLDESKVDKWTYLIDKMTKYKKKDNKKGFETTLNSYPKEKSSLYVLEDILGARATRNL